MITEMCFVCENEYTEPDPPTPQRKNIPPEDFVCGECWAYINFSNLSTEEIIKIIRSEKNGI